MDNSSTENWFVLTTKPKSEQRAVENLTSQGIEVYFPKVKQLKRRQGKKVVAEEALFPNYIFVKLNADKDNFNAIRSTRGVSSFVRFGLSYAQASENLITQLKGDIGNQLEQTNLTSLTKFKKGEKLIVTDGLFEGLSAIYHCKGGLERSVLLLNILGKENKVVIENEHFDKK